MKKIVIIVFSIVIASCLLYYFIPRDVAFEQVIEISKPNEEFDRSYFIGFNYVSNEEKLMFFMVDYYEKSSCVKANLKGYDREYIKGISRHLDYEKFDYIITWQKKLKALKHSPYLSNKKDDIDYSNEIPLIPTYEPMITDKVYIYRIKKKLKFRAPGP